MAVGLARSYEARLIALHVAMPIDPGRSLNPADYIRVHAAARMQGAVVLHAVRDLVRDLVPFTAELEFGDPAATICRRAKELDADLLIVGSRGLGKLDRLLLEASAQQWSNVRRARSSSYARAK